MEKKEKKEILRKNPQPDQNVISDFERLAKELKKLGVDLSSKYTLGSPLGDSVIPTSIKPKSTIKTRK